MDAWFIDGDHSWYTVFHELKAIDEVSKRDAKPMLVFLHDESWPCARRGSYYAPARIPAKFRQPYDYDGGAIPGRSKLMSGTGFRGMGKFAWAVREGGERNGVLTAVEDFVAETGRPMAFAEIPAVFGLGILFDQDAPWSESLGHFLLPYPQSALLVSLERNRSANYLRVIELQEAMARRGAA